MTTSSKQKRGLSFVGCQIPPWTYKRRAGGEAWGKKQHVYKPLPKQFRHNGFNYRQIAREGDAAIYEQTWNACSDPALCFEVIRVKPREAFQIDGRLIEPAEVYPNSEGWTRTVSR